MKEASIISHLLCFFDPDSSEQLRYIIEIFHLKVYINNILIKKDLESTDYRSAYRQFCDWMYGWKVTDGSNKNTFVETTAQLQKYVRNIDFNADMEKSEMDRLLNVFETLFLLARRTLGKKFLDIEFMVGRVGMGLKTLSNAGNANASGLPPIPNSSTMGNVNSQQPLVEEDELAQLPSSFKQTNMLEPNRAPRFSIIVEKNASNFSRKMSMMRKPLIRQQLPKSVPKDNEADIEDMFIELNKTLDYAILCITILYIKLTLSELRDRHDIYTKNIQYANELFADFVTYFLSTLWQMLQKDTMLDIELQQFRVLHILSLKLEESFAVSKDRKAINAVHTKLNFLNILFMVLDIHIFPPAIAAHSIGSSAKGLRCSTLDNTLWLTGGYDGIVRIYEFKEPWTLYAQFVGHTSIVTDVNFAKGDTIVISSSFDRTVRLWNSSTAICEKIMIGHDDAVTSCDITIDGRYAISGSLDSTVRFWDCTAGAQLSCIKKHTKWVKCVRFTFDARYFVTASLDCKIYIWETKSAISGKVNMPVKAIDIHLDAIIDLAVHRHHYILTCSRDRTIKLTEFTTGREIQTIDLGTSRWGCAVAFSKDGNLFAIATSDQNVLIYDTKRGVEIRKLRVFNMGIVSCRFPPMEVPTHVIVGTQDGFIQRLEL
jgi:hypothetical protein